jgi:hypothetical protein
MLCSSVAACAETALVMKDATVYASAKTSSKKLGKLKAGTQLELVAEKSGWAKVELNGNVGYMKASTVAEYETYSSKTAYTTDSTPMYKSFSSSSKKLGTIAVSAQTAIANTRGEGYVDSGVKILIAVVIGALLLGGLYTLFDDTIMPTVTTKIQNLFNYAG